MLSLKSLYPPGVVDLSVNIDSIQLVDGGLILRGRTNGLPLRLKVQFGPEADTHVERVFSEISKNTTRQRWQAGPFYEWLQNTLEWVTRLTLFKGP